MSALTDMLSSFLQEAASAVKQAGPEVWDLSCAALRVASIIKLCFHGFLTLMWLAVSSAEIALIVKAVRLNDGNNLVDVACIPMGLATVLLTIYCLVYWTSYGYLDLLGAISGKMAVVYRVGLKTGIFKNE